MLKEPQSFTQNRQERPVHPGEVIADILDDLEISQIRFAETLGISQQIVNEIIQGKQPITVDLAIRIGQALGNGHGLWLNLQQKVDIWDAWKMHQQDYEQVLTLV